MAFTLAPKLFLPDLSNYAEIRRGLSPAVRSQTPTLKELRSVDSATQQGLINALNDWRLSGQAQKIKGAQTSKGLGAVFSNAAASGYYSTAEKITIQTAGLNLKTMDPRQAEWAIRESLNSTGRLHNQDFYKAKYYLDSGEWSPEAASGEMLSAILYSGGILEYNEETIQATIREYVKRVYGTLEDLEAENTERANITAGYYNDVLNIAKIFTR